MCPIWTIEEITMVDAALHARGPGRRHVDEKAVRQALKALDAPVAGATSREVDSLARVISIVWDVVEELPTVKRGQVVGDRELLRAAIRQVWSRQKALVRRKRGTDEVERSQGAGLGQQISVEEGRARLDRYVTARPLEIWAGQVAGAGEIERALGIPRSTLSNWRNRGAAVGLLRGERKLAYPLEQFVDARPIQGLADVIRVARDERSAWLWLRQPHTALQDRLPIDALKSGDREVVVRAAERDFG
jgi:hypothetical protein